MLGLAFGGERGSLPYASYDGPERRSRGVQAPDVFSLMLDEIDYGMILLDHQGSVTHLNRAARRELTDEHPLQMLGSQVVPRAAADGVRLREALTNASRRGLRKLMLLGEGESEVKLAVIPLPADGTLLVLGKRRLSERISVDCFARLHKLTPAESRVLEGLCEGLEPKEVAELNVVGVATVRTQIGSIRAKTGADSIRALVRQVAVLPPIVGALRC